MPHDYPRRRWAEEVCHHLEALPTREATVLRLLYLAEPAQRTERRIAERTGLSRDQVRAAAGAGLARLGHCLQAGSWAKRPDGAAAAAAASGRGPIVSEDSYADLLERIFADFEQWHSLAVIEQVVDQCRAELAGQTPTGAQLQMIDSLARLRLTELHTDPRSTPDE